MNRYSLSWAPRPRCKSQKPHLRRPLDIATCTAPVLPTLPHEVWSKIIAFTVRLSGANSIDLDDAFSPPCQNEEYPEIESGVFEDRASLMRVSSRWRKDVRIICCEYLTIYTAAELIFLANLFDASRDQASVEGESFGKPLGDWTLRIDFKILGPYSVPHVVRLLQCTPNLLIYNNRNGPATVAERPAPQEVLSALVTHCAHSLRRVEWSGAGEAPRFQDLATLCNALPHLTTLRLVAIYSFPLQASDGIPEMIILPKLKTLSLGTIPRPVDYRPEFAVTWDPLLHYISFHSHQLPALTRFECEIFPLSTLAFFDVHGPKLRLFRTAAASAEHALPHALALCPDLHTLVLAQGTECIDVPNFHPTLRRICIVPTIDVAVRVPLRVFKHAIVDPLDALLKTLEEMFAPQLCELRVRNVGAYSGIYTESIWLNFWWRRWNIRGVRFCDKAGRLFQTPYDCECSTFSLHGTARLTALIPATEALLNRVRM